MLADLLSRTGAGEFLISWNSAKVFVEYLTGVSHDLLHLLVGLAAWLLIAAITRRTISSPLPLLLTLGLAAINEAADLKAEIWPDASRQYGELAKDLLTTIAVPLILFVVARLHPPIFRVGKR